MSQLPVPLKKRALRRPRETAVEVIAPLPQAGPFFSLSYSHTEISASGGTTQVKSRRTRLEDGKLVSESFDGELPLRAYEQAVQAAQQQILAQANWMLQSFSWFLPLSRKP